VIFLKLGGSIITDKKQIETAQYSIIERLAFEIARACQANSDLQLVLGHGSGSFGHYAAAKHGTHMGASTRDDWLGFSNVWSAADRLNRLILDQLRAVGLSPVRFSPSSSAIASDGKLIHMSVEPIVRCLEAGLLPVVYGDVAFDRQRGSTILSTEQIFSYLAEQLKPQRLLFAGIEPGVYADYSVQSEIVPIISECNLQEINFSGATGTDVTGGMAEKVRLTLEISRRLSSLEVRIFSGLETGTVENALAGGSPGTLILFGG
jgi:isopentenyl phosphate kinase